MFHDGERAVQRRAGVERDAARVGRVIMSWIPREYAGFLTSQTFVVLAGHDARGRPWASLMAGQAGFARVLGHRRLLMAGQLAATDPLAAAFEPPGGSIGILAIQPETRSRVRLNGAGQRTPDGILVEVTEVFGNCRKFIQQRLPGHGLDPPPRPRRPPGTGLDAYQAALIRGADTFFIASSHPQRGADVSHRGGRPGFVEISDDAGTLRFPDYPGNRMFQTLGNITIDPHASLLFADWQTGSALQLTGRARIVWDKDQIAHWPGAERLVEVAIDVICEQERVLPARWTLIEASRVNPPLTAS
jgi:predicted pyridoxine 5'-phosphate oxidase superfamily flavin-nucleotide-binding protein